jgi:hypothetical protein
MEFHLDKPAAYRGILLTAALAILSMLAGCAQMQSGLQRFMPGASANGGASAPPATLEQAWTIAAEECGGQIEPPPANACGALAQRGRTLQCLAAKFARSGAVLGYPSPDGLENWRHCVDDVGAILVGGTYLRAAEIERRTLLCHANLAAAPDARKPEVLTRLRKFLGFNAAAEEEKRLAPAGFGAQLRSTPFDSQKCTSVMALVEPMQPQAQPTRPAVAAMPVSMPVPAVPVAQAKAIEAVNGKPAVATKPAPGAKKPAPAKKPAAKITSS